MSSEKLNELQANVYSVTKLTREIKECIEDNWPDIWVQGEISNYKRHFSGHCYFTLKDANAQIACVWWKGKQSGLNFLPTDGLQVMVRGELSVYEKQGKYQLNVDIISPLGIGELQLAFDRLKQKLYDEGLFDSRWKKPLPRFPECIGIITSPTGAVIQDIVSVLDRRFPAVKLIINPVHVQGEEAPAEICQAIEDFNRFGRIDLLIVGRGGGSLEDLWAFNDESVARTIFESEIPVISAVGHEIDFSISDFVADHRAPTPSAAAEMAVPDRDEVAASLENFSNRIYKSLESKITTARDKVEAIARSYAFNRPIDIVYQCSQRLDELFQRLSTNYTHVLSTRRSDLSHLTGHLSALNPYAILNRGYSICYRHPEGDIVREGSSVSPGDKINVRLAKGGIVGTVDKSTNESEQHDGSKEF